MSYLCIIYKQDEIYSAGVWKKTETPLTIKFKYLGGGFTSIKGNKINLDKELTIYKNQNDKRNLHDIIKMSVGYKVFYNYDPNFYYEFIPTK